MLIWWLHLPKESRRQRKNVYFHSPGGTVVKNPPVRAGDTRDLVLTPGSGSSTGGRNGNLPPYSCLKNSVDRGVWQATVDGVTELGMTECTRAHICIHITKGISLVKQIKVLYFCLSPSPYLFTLSLFLLRKRSRQSIQHSVRGRSWPINWWILVNGTQLQYSCLENPWAEEPGGLQSMGSLRVGHDWATSLSLFSFMHWRRKWQPTPVFLPGESQGWGSLVGCCLWGRTEGHDWSDLAAAAAAVYSFVSFMCGFKI